MDLTEFEYDTQRLAAGYFIWIRNVVKAMVLVSMASASNSALAADAYFLDATGQVSVAVGKNAPRIVVKNETIASGAVVRTGDGSQAVLKFEDGQVVSMQPNTTFQIREYRYVSKQAGTEKNSIVFSMLKGGMRFVTGQIGQRNPQAFRLITPHATIGIRGTEFMVVLKNNAIYNKVLTGSTSMTNSAGTTILSAGQTGLATSATKLTVILSEQLVPAGTFSQISTIPLSAPAPLITPVPAPAPALAPVPTPPTSAAVSKGAATVTGTSPGTAATTTAAGGAVAGGAEASTATVTGGAATGISVTAIGIGAGIAAVAAASLNNNTTTTTHH